eukprot:jgi/Chrzof1/15250/UNPLg00644.t1
MTGSAADLPPEARLLAAVKASVYQFRIKTMLKLKAHARLLLGSHTNELPAKKCCLRRNVTELFMTHVPGVPARCAKYICSAQCAQAAKQLVTKVKL